MSTRNVRTWEARIASGEFTRGQARYWAQSVARLAAGLPPAGARSAMTGTEAKGLAERLIVPGVRLTAEHEAAGKRWLLTYGARTFGGRFGRGDYPAELVADTFDHFEFHGEAQHAEDEIPVAWHDRPTSWPIWHVVLTGGERFAYLATPWARGDRDVQSASWWPWPERCWMPDADPALLGAGKDGAWTTGRTANGRDVARAERGLSR